MALCRWLYNRLLSELNFAHEKGIRLKRTDTQALIVDLKQRELPELNEVIEGKVKGVIVKRERSGKWYAIFQVEGELEPLPKTGKAVGIDVGTRHASWGKFFHALAYKAGRAGRRFVEVNPRGTSQIPEGFDRELGRPERTPAEIGPLPRVPASAVVAGHVPSLRQEAPCESWG